MIIHLGENTGEKTYVCYACQKGFVHEHDVNEHLGVHMGTRR